ncbi:Hypothetical predicted protein [Cloeon dipterum]|uniref:Dynein axonemal intermediate chain 4 n=1 Tax=Cloeon dipterum TaxID=197152 RepID=A0A8S1DVF0_9INSE|nr:Hypothetical predicted protein [Cloeon dipterum]
MFQQTLRKLNTSKFASKQNSKKKQQAGDQQSAPKPLVDPFLDRIFLQASEIETSAKKSCCFSTKAGSFEKSESQRPSEVDSIRLQEILRKNHALNGNAFGDKGSSALEIPAGEIITEQKLEQEKIGLHETETIKLLEIQSTATPKDLLLPDANIESAATAVAAEHVVDMKSKKMVEAKTQTMNLQVKQKSTMTTPLLSRDVECEATVWDLFDATMDQGETSRKEELNPKFISLPWCETGRRESQGEEQKAPQLGKSAMVIERFLASNLYKSQQAMYFGQSAKIDDKKRTTRFQYELCPLWTYHSAATKNKSVLNLAWNTTNSNILAVAYGQFLLSEDKQGGLVCCWSTKNLTQPERCYPFEHSVSALAFSLNSQLLVVGLQDGKIIVLDVSHAEKKAIVQASLKNGGHVGPVWVLKSVQWTHGEAIVSAGEDGQLLIWSLNLSRIGRFFARIPISLQKKEKVGAADMMDEVPIQEVFSILDFSVSNGADPLILVATKEGYLLEVEMELQIQRVVRAHLGPIYKVQVSPFCWQLALTAGADGKVLLWARSKKDAPILSLAVSASAVVCAEWSPSFSTIVACASGTFLSIWDLARKTHEPVTKVNIGAALTSLVFSPDGMNVLVGDRTGKIHVHSLQDMPYKPLMPVEALLKAIPGLVLL